MADERNSDTPPRTFIAHRRSEDGMCQSLACHLFQVAQHTKTFAAKINENLAEAGELLGFLHDLGKYSDAFQKYIKSATGLLNQDVDEEFVDATTLKGKIDHSTAGAQFVWKELCQHKTPGQIAGQILALCLASHHSGMIDCLTAEPDKPTEDAFGRRMAKDDQRTHLCEALNKANVAILDRVRQISGSSTLVDSLTGAIQRIVALERNSSETVILQKVGLLVRYLFSCLIDADRIDSADFENPRQAKQRQLGNYQGWATLVERLERHLASLSVKHPIDHLRQRISHQCLQRASDSKGIYTLTVPTGGGKTLASLRFALHHAKTHQMDRVIYVVPFTTIIDQNADRTRDILESDGVIQGSVLLEHHSNLTPEKQTWRGKILSENWDAPLVYTTSVQFLETLFGAGTRSARRMHQLANSVLIFDEIQALPINCVHLFNNAINFLVEHCGSTAVLCTATQPLFDQVDVKKGAIRVADGSELIHDVKGLFDDLKRVEVLDRRKPSGWSSDEIADLALDKTVRTGSCLVVVNTKNAARELYRLCRDRGEVSVFHLSTNMCPAHRKAKLKEIAQSLDLDRSAPTLCISTQLIEAGVDLDFGTVIRFMAGLDSIAQAAGRCNRNKRREIGFVHIINPRDENLGMLPEIRIGQTCSERILNDYADDPAKFGNMLIGPEAMRWFYQNYFFARASEMTYPVSARHLGRDDTLLNLLSVNSSADGEYRRITGKTPPMYLRQSFMAAARAFKAIDAPTRGVIVPYGEEGREIIAELCSACLPEKQGRLMRQAQQYTVNVYPNTLKELDHLVAEVPEETGILFLTVPEYYDLEFGLN